MQEPLLALFRDHLATVRSRCESALAACRFDGVVIAAGQPPLQFGDDQAYPFKANPRFRLWVPEAWPGSFLAFRPGERPRLMIHQPVDFWHKPPALPEEPWTGEFELVVLREPAEVRGQLPGGRLALLGAPDPAWDGLGTANPPELVARLDYARAAKTPYEVECLALASRHAARAHRAAEAAFRAGASEYEVHLEYCRAAGVREEELPYNNIIAFGPNAAVLHYQHLERRRPPGTPSFLIDAGAPHAGYGSDVTRTYSATPGDEFAELVGRLDTLQQELAAQVVPGRDYRDIHLDAHRRIGALLVETGYVRGSAEAAVETGATAVFFPHGIGHLLGLQVHDVGGLYADEAGTERPRPAGHPFLRLTRVLEPGFVVTIEPGLYAIEPLLAEAARGALRSVIDWERVERLRPCGGIRIEDNVVALPGGPRNLTREAFAAAA